MSENFKETPEGRLLADVLEQILKVIPDDRTEIKKTLEWHINDSGFKPPELQYHCWQGVARYLNSVLCPPTKEWQKEAIKIFNG